jgi:hypothetical protein
MWLDWIGQDLEHDPDAEGRVSAKRMKDFPSRQTRGASAEIMLKE